MGSKIKIGPKKKIAFVCSGGASKAGAFHIGVALALQEQGFSFFGGVDQSETPAKSPDPMEISTYVGSSAGSIVATYLAAGYSLESIFDSFLNKKSQSTDKTLARLTYPKLFKLRTHSAKQQLKSILTVRKLFNRASNEDFEPLSQFRFLNTSGLFSTSGIEQYFREEVLTSNSFQDHPADLFITATQLNHSRKVVFGKYHYEPPPHDLTCQYNDHATISEAVAASTALPFVYSPYPIKNDDGSEVYYIDGEVRDTLSTHVAFDAGADLVIASHTYQPYHLTEKVGSLTQLGLPAILVQSLYLVIEQKINNHIHNKRIQRSAINAVYKYCKENNVGKKHTEQIQEILQDELHHRLDVDTIYVHPKSSDTRMFIRDHFSLNPDKMSEIVSSGFKAGIDVLRKYHFDDRKKQPKTSHS